MKRALILCLCLLFAAGAANAGIKNGSKVPDEVMYPIEYYQGGQRPLFEGFESGVPPIQPLLSISSRNSPRASPAYQSA